MRTALATATLALFLTPAPAARRPDVVLFLTDDLGWADCSPYGGGTSARRTWPGWPATA